MALSVPEQWTEDEVNTRFNVRSEAPAFQDGTLSPAQEQALGQLWDNLQEVARYLIGGAHSSDPEAQRYVGSLYEAAFHATAFLAPADTPGTDTSSDDDGHA